MQLTPSEHVWLCLEDRACKLPLQRAPPDGCRLEFRASPGLYQFSVIADAREFNWDELYFNLRLFGNQGQRTGPWDFNLLDGNKPLVPSYWVSLNGRRIGLWYFQRVSLEDIQQRRFRGRMAFQVAEAGDVTLELRPYRPFRVRWMSAVIEPDPDDHLERVSFPTGRGAQELPAAQWGRTEFWRQMRANLATTHAMYAKPLRRGFDWVCSREKPEANHIALLIAAHRLEDRADALARALNALDNAVAAPHWGNPQEDGYGHDGDMGAASVLRSLAWAYHALQNELGEDRRARLIEKLTLQGNRFLELALLNRDYWGGSVLQDHGWQSLFAFGVAALHLLGVIPAAERWVWYARPRLRRSLEAMPRDGAIPLSSYCSLYLYLDEVTHYRDALLALSDEDIFQQYPFHSIVDYMIAALRGQDRLMLIHGAEAVPFIGGNGFLNRMTALHRDGRAARLQRMLLETTADEFYHPTQEFGYFMGALRGFLAHDPSVPPVERLPQPKRLTFFEDSGLAHYRDDEKNVTLSVHCGPWCGYNAYRRAQGPCDRMGLAPGAGHFIVALGSKPLLVTPDSGYRLNSALRTCLLVDGKGQHGDIGYPMSIPSLLHRGEEIQWARWDETSGTGVIRLNLAPAYPAELGLACYTRDFIISKDRRIICRDHVVLNAPHRLSWLFQGRRENGLGLEGLRGWFGRDPRLWLEARADGFELSASLRETEVVWAYASAGGFKPFDHVRFDSVTEEADAAIDFTITW